ncbi:MAG TPA: DUF2800 domain-containing protein [Dongiaceae bacterium]|nr:DUF2800 domain-containing protein [Dongiaceae bacterium]
MNPIVRCSQLDRLLNCPGSRTLEEIVGKRGGDDGNEGTALHWETAWRLVRELGAAQPEGGLPALSGPEFGIPSYVAWIVDWCFRIVRDEVDPSWALEVEPELSWPFENFTLVGHLDVAATSPDGKESNDFDWKTGRIPVLPADCNWQVAGYMALRRLIYGVDKARFTIAQPWNDEAEGYERQSVVEIEAEALNRNVAEIERRVNAALEDGMLLNTGLSQCKWCVGCHCPAIQKLLHTMQVRLTPETLAGIKANLDDPLLVNLVADARTLAKPIEDATDMLKDRLKASGPITVGDRTVTLLTQNAGFRVVNPVGMFGWLKTLLRDEQLAPALSYPGTRIKDQIAVALDVPKTGKAPVTAKSVFEGGAAAFIEQKTKDVLQFS